jgi:thiol-disulfide isomerase/thioredoxin
VRRPLAAVLVSVFALGACAGCGSDDPESHPADLSQLKGSPPPLAKLHAQANRLLDGGPDAFRERLASLKGYPVVVNKWAAWCGPCRNEFPHFQDESVRLGKKVAFIGVDANDNDENARDFLADYPVAYPSYKDPDVKISDVFNATLSWPSTAFYDRKGELAYLHQGPYADAEALSADIERYAR